MPSNPFNKCFPLTCHFENSILIHTRYPLFNKNNSKVIPAYPTLCPQRSSPCCKVVCNPRCKPFTASPDNSYIGGEASPQQSPIPPWARNYAGGKGGRPTKARFCSRLFSILDPLFGKNVPKRRSTVIALGGKREPDGRVFFSPRGPRRGRAEIAGGLLQSPGLNRRAETNLAHGMEHQ